MPRKSVSGDSGVLQSYATALSTVQNQFISHEFNLPLLNLPNKSPSQYIAVEIHKVEIFRTDALTHPIHWLFGSNSLTGVNSAAPAIPNASVDPRTIAAGTLGASESYSLFDFTDDTDRGLLYPNQKMYITASGLAQVPTAIVVKFWYKVVHVSQPSYLAMMNNYFLLG